MRPIFFLHVPKTAGSSVNAFFSRTPRSVVHVEARPDIYPELREFPEHFDFVSGHILYERCKSLIDMDRWFTFTLLREPIDHVVSHIRWVKAFAGDAHAKERSRHPKQTQELCARLRDVDLNDVAALRDIIDDVPQARLFFDNMQCRFFLEGKASRLAAEDARLAILATELLGYVGLCEEAESAARTILEMTGREPGEEPFPNENPSPLPEMPDFSDRAVRDFYFSLVEQDMALYERWAG